MVNTFCEIRPCISSAQVLFFNHTVSTASSPGAPAPSSSRERMLRSPSPEGEGAARGEAQVVRDDALELEDLAGVIYIPHLLDYICIRVGVALMPFRTEWD